MLVYGYGVFTRTPHEGHKFLGHKFFLNLRPVTFNYKSDETQAQQFGLIAEEVQQVLPALVVRGADGEIETVKYHELAVLLLNELIKQQAVIENLNARLSKLEARA